MENARLELHLNAKLGVAPYLQIVQQVRRAVRLGLLQPGDQLPTVKQVVASLAINPNTVLKAYRELELEGVIAGRRGLGTFVLSSIEGQPSERLISLRRALDRWVDEAHEAGLDLETVSALLEDALRSAQARFAA